MDIFWINDSVVARTPANIFKNRNEGFFILESFGIDSSLRFPFSFDRYSYQQRSRGSIYLYSLINEVKRLTSRWYKERNEKKKKKLKKMGFFFSFFVF